MLFVIALGGFVSQLAQIRARAREGAGVRGYATQVLSLNYFSVSFLAYFAFFTYGFSVQPFNPYLVWPRLLGCVLVLANLIAIAQDRRGPLTMAISGVASTLLLGGVVLLASGADLGLLQSLAPQVLTLIATVLVAQSLIHQVVLVRRAGHAGAVSWPLHFLTLLKDLSTVVFGLAMGLRTGWPLLLMGGMSAGIKVILLWHLRRAR